MRAWLTEALRLAASLRVTVAGLLILLVLTVWGTLYQAEHGLYAAQERFYQSWSFLIGGWMPFPGAQSVMVVLFANLAASLLHMAATRRLRTGFVLTHAGLALMLAAGGFTFYFGRHANLALEEGAAANVAVAAETWELAVMPSRDGARRLVRAIDLRALRTGRSIRLPGSDLVLHAETAYANADARRDAQEHAPTSAGGFTRLVRRPAADDPQHNRPGLILRVERGNAPLGRLLLWAGDAAPTPLPGLAEPAVIGLRPARLPLPATIELVDFQRELHPGTGLARSYASQVVVREPGGGERRVRIAMNKPLRLGGFTFYQSSFNTAPGGRETSVLAVVKNHGRLFPYVATGLTGAGMLVHFTGLLLAGTRRRPEADR